VLIMLIQRDWTVCCICGEEAEKGNVSKCAPLPRGGLCKTCLGCMDGMEQELSLLSSPASCAVVVRPHLPDQDDLLCPLCNPVQAGEECGIQVGLCAACASTVDNPNITVFTPHWLEKAFLSVIHASWMAARKKYRGGRVTSSQQWLVKAILGDSCRNEQE
jgi:hypothetical protein